MARKKKPEKLRPRKNRPPNSAPYAVGIETFTRVLVQTRRAGVLLTHVIEHFQT